MTPKRHLGVIAAAWLAAAAPTWASAQEAAKNAAGAPAPSVEIPKMKIDLGRVYQRDKYEYDFLVRNRGNANLVIDVRPGCGCTAARFDSVIAPGGEGHVELVVDGSKVDGEFAKNAAVETNDPKYPQLTLIVAATEIPFLSVTPAGTVFLQGRYGETVEQELTLVSNESDLDFKVTSVTSDIDDKITYALAPGAKKGEYALRVSKNPTLPTMSVYGSIFVKTNSARAPETILQVQVMTKGSITVNPTVLNFGPVKFGTDSAPAEPVSRSITVTKATTTGRFQVQDVTLSNPRFVAVVESITAGEAYRISVTFTPPVKKANRQNEKAEMIIHTDDEREPAIRVQVVARTI